MLQHEILSCVLRSFLSRPTRNDVSERVKNIHSTMTIIRRVHLLGLVGQYRRGGTKDRRQQTGKKIAEERGGSTHRVTF